MRIELFKSSLCPRCVYAAHILKKMQDEFDGLEIISYDIATDFKAFKNSNIRMIPTIQFEQQKESWILPKASKIREFIVKNRCSKERSASQTS